MHALFEDAFGGCVSFSYTAVTKSWTAFGHACLRCQAFSALPPQSAATQNLQNSSVKASVVGALSWSLLCRVHVHLDL